MLSVPYVPVSVESVSCARIKRDGSDSYDPTPESQDAVAEPLTNETVLTVATVGIEAVADDARAILDTGDAH